MLEVKNELDYTKNTMTKDFSINKDIAKILEEGRLLNVYVTSQSKSYVLNVAYEDDEHTVIKERFTILSRNILQKTDINVPYISLTNCGIFYYLPYKGSEVLND